MPDNGPTFSIGVVDEAVGGGKRPGGLKEDLALFADRLVDGDRHRAAFVSGVDQSEQDRGAGLILADTGEVIEDRQIDPVEPGDGCRECEFAARDLQPLDGVERAVEQRDNDPDSLSGCRLVTLKPASAPRPPSAEPALTRKWPPDRPE